MKKILEKLHIFGYRRWQPLFSRIEYYCLVGMNMGRGGATSSSGEEAVLSYISKKSHAHLTVFDVGANVGLYTRLIKESLPTTTSIHSFEPTKHAFKQLLANVAGLSNVHLNNLGLSDKKGSIELFSDVAGSGLGSVYNRRLDHFGVHNTKKEQIEMTDIDSYCKEHKIARIDFLKIDVEGHEIAVLRGFDLSRWRPRVMLIEDKSDLHVTEVERHMSESGYRRFYRSGGNDWYVNSEPIGPYFMLRAILAGQADWRGLLKVWMPRSLVRFLLLVRRSLLS